MIKITINIVDYIYGKKLRVYEYNITVNPKAVDA